MSSTLRAAAAAALLSTVALGAGPAWSAGGSTPWSYSGATGATSWGSLSPAFAACDQGLMQSPIDLTTAGHRAETGIEIEYREIRMEILHNGHTVQVNVGNESVLQVAGVAFTLIQVHFHTPSEHTMNGNAFPLEAHFVHQSADGRLAVIGVFFEEGEAHEALGTLIEHMPSSAAEPRTVDAVFDPEALLPERRDIYRYMGSLTTPPCSEGVNWHVIHTPLQASADQIARMRAAMGMNARPVQPLNNRLLLGPSD